MERRFFGTKIAVLCCKCNKKPPVLVLPAGIEPNKPTFLTRKILDFIAYFKIFVEKLSKKLSPFNVVFIQKRKAYVITLLSALRRMAHFLIKNGRRGLFFDTKTPYSPPHRFNGSRLANLCARYYLIKLLLNARRALLL